MPQALLCGAMVAPGLFDEDEPPPAPFGCDAGRSRPAEWIENDMLAIENVHDAINDLIAANSTLSLIRTTSGKGQRHGVERLYDSLGNQIDSARKRIWSLARHSRMEDFNPKPHKLRAILKQAVALVQHDIDRVNIFLDFDCPANLVHSRA